MYCRTFDKLSSKACLVDLRSDTLAVPTEQMKKAMFEAVVGDDVYGEDPTVNELEERTAKLFEKEAAVFVPSGTMANLLAIMVHCDQRGSEVIVGNWSHIFRFEQGSSAGLAHVFCHNIPNLDDGTFSIDDIRNNVRGSDFHEPTTQLVTIEQTHNMAGGKVIPLDWIEELSKVCKEKHLALHMDGARIFNAAEYLKVPVSRVARDVDSVCFCLSKGLCCPVGSLLVGTKQFADKARRLRKSLGGAMRQVGFLAAAGLCALETIVPLLGNDHRHTRQFAEAIDNLNSPIFKVDVKGLQTNILMIKVLENSKKVTALDLSNRLAEVRDIELTDGVTDKDQNAIIIKSNCKNASTLRVVFYHQIDDELTQMAIKKVIYVMKELQQ